MHKWMSASIVFGFISGVATADSTKLATTPTISPIESQIMRVYGVYEVNGRRQMNDGVDFFPSAGALVRATASGTVAKVSTDGITIVHVKGLKTRYGHLKAVKVKEGDRVQKGQTIGVAGKTSLHYEIHASDLPVDPAGYIPGALGGNI